MRHFQTVVFIVAVATLLLTASRHVRLAYFVDRAATAPHDPSIRLDDLDGASEEADAEGLDSDDQKALRIAKAKNAMAKEIRWLGLEELRGLHKTARVARQAFDAEAEKAWERHLADHPATAANDLTKPEWERERPKILFKEEWRKEDPARELAYYRDHLLSNALQEWKRMNAAMREMRYYWGVGLGLFLLGGILYRWSTAMGMSLVITGAVLMVWWSTPSFGLSGTVAEGDRVLMARLIMTGVALSVIVIGYILAPLWEREKKS